ELAKKAMGFDTSDEAEICLAWCDVIEIDEDNVMPREQKLKLLETLTGVLDELGIKKPDYRESYYYRTKVRRLRGKLSTRLQEAELRTESIEIFERQQARLETLGSNTIWVRRNIAIQHIFRGLVLAQAGESKIAVACFETGLIELEKILEQSPSFIVILADMAEAYWLKQQVDWSDQGFFEPTETKGYKRTIELFERLLSIEPTNNQTYIRLTEIHDAIFLKFKRQSDLPNAKQHLVAAVDSQRQLCSLPSTMISHDANTAFRSTLLKASKELGQMGFEEIALEYEAEAQKIDE
ncbi:MAG: hypothetical protein AAGA30_21110, partial [Planctomycetota bacterium]